MFMILKCYQIEKFIHEIYVKLCCTLLTVSYKQLFKNVIAVMKYLRIYKKSLSPVCT
jgi:hypothetical protein